MVVAGLDEALAKCCREQLTEKPDVLVLHSLTGIDPEFIPQQDSQAFIRREGLRYVVARRERTHQKQMSGLAERGHVDKFARGTLRARQFGAPDS